jgi:hypothetical protein
MAKPDENTTRHTIPVRTLCPISINLPPHAVCTLSAVGADAGSGLTVVAGSRGDAKIFARADDATSEPLRLEIHEASGRRSGRVVEIQARSDRRLRHSFATRPMHKSIADRTDLAMPAATRRELEQLSAADLLQRGLPQRPDPDLFPADFLAWQTLATTGFELVEPELVQRHDIQRGAPNFVLPHQQVGLLYSDVWSGIQVRNANASYDLVGGQWTVPAILNGEFQRNSDSLIWVGIDGFDTADLVQAGTGQYNTAYNVGGIPINLSSYFAWTEFLPQQPLVQQIANFNVSPGDVISTSVVVRNPVNDPPPPGGHVTPSDDQGSDGIFDIYNFTTRQRTRVVTPRGATTVGGHQAEWVVERPRFGDTPSDLANYGSVQIRSAYAGRAQNGQIGILDDDSYEVYMQIDQRRLSDAVPINDSAMQFYWHAFS